MLGSEDVTKATDEAEPVLVGHEEAYDNRIRLLLGLTRSGKILTLALLCINYPQEIKLDLAKNYLMARSRYLTNTSSPLAF